MRKGLVAKTVLECVCLGRAFTALERWHMFSVVFCQLCNFQIALGDTNCLINTDEQKLLFAFCCSMCGSNRRHSDLLCPAHSCLSCLQCDACPFCFTFGAFVWLAGEVQQAHRAETKGVTAVWSVGFQALGSGEVQVRNSCSSQSGLPWSCTRQLGNRRSFMQLKQGCSSRSNVDWKQNLLLWEAIYSFNGGIIWW